MLRPARSQGSTLELALLGFLAEEPLHGYELRRRVEACFGPLVRASWGSIYPALGRLEQRRLVTVDRREGTNLRGLTGSLAGELALAALGSSRSSSKTRRVYRITPLGESALEAMLEQLDLEDDRGFWFGVAFTTRWSTAQRLALLEARQRVLEERRTLLGEATLAGEGYQQVREGLGYRIDAELEWLRRHIKDLRENAPSGAS
jgi:DNA-binding PadR family transcriptional regulator